MPELRPFQEEDLQAIAKNKYRALIANAPGTGKTAICLRCIGHEPKRLLPVLIVCPASVVRNWKKEARMWIPGTSVKIIDDTTTPIPNAKYDLYIVSWSLLAMRWQELIKLECKLIIADECHYAKNEEAQRTTALIQVAAKAPHLLMLSGTPVVNNTEELRIINSVFGSKRPIMIRRLLEDVAKDIPPKKRARVSVKLPKHIESRYKSAAEDFSAWLEKEIEKRSEEGKSRIDVVRSVTAEALIKIGYLRRIIAAGKVFAAIDFTARLVRAGEPVVLFCEHQEVLKKIQKGLKKQRITYVTIDGSTSTKERHRAVQRFQANKAAVFIGSKAAKEGITLTAARNLIMVERYWTAADEEQAEDRIRRIGQIYPTTIWFLHAKNTVDDRIADIIEKKRIIVRNAIGSADIIQTPEKVALEMISDWDANAKAAKTANYAVNLGIDDPLPPLPETGKVYALCFEGSRWTTTSAQLWARMLHYPVNKIVETAKGFQLRILAPSNFIPGSFKRQRIAHDLSVLVGERRKPR